MESKTRTLLLKKSVAMAIVFLHDPHRFAGCTQSPLSVAPFSFLQLLQHGHVCRNTSNDSGRTSFLSARAAPSRSAPSNAPLLPHWVDRARRSGSTSPHKTIPPPLSLCHHAPNRRHSSRQSTRVLAHTNRSLSAPVVDQPICGTAFAHT